MTNPKNALSEVETLQFLRELARTNENSKFAGPRMAGRFAGAFKHILKLNVQCSAGTFWFNTTYSQSPDCRLFLPNLCFI